MYESYDPFQVNADQEKTRNHFYLKSYLLTNKAVYIPSKPRWHVLRAFNKILNTDDIDIIPYMALYVSVRYNEIQKRWIVFEAKSRTAAPL
jgi:hypothetical protein